MTPANKKLISAYFPDLAGHFKADETNEIIGRIFAGVSMIKGDKGDTGERGTNGESYILNKSDKIEIASLVKIPIIDKVIERIETIKEVFRERPIDVSMVKGAVSKKELSESTKKIESGMEFVEGRIKLIDQRWRGGGLSKVSTDSTLTGSGTPSSPLSVIGGGGSTTFYTETPLGLINGSNMVYTTLNPIGTIVTFAIDQTFIHPVQYTYTGNTITFTSPFDESLSSSPFTIVYTSTSSPPVTTSHILTEDGFSLLTETGDKLTLE